MTEYNDLPFDWKQYALELKRQLDALEEKWENDLKPRIKKLEEKIEVLETSDTLRADLATKDFVHG